MRKHKVPSSLYDAVKVFAASRNLIPKASRVLAAVSGGVDSVVLLDLLSSLANEWDLDIAILHVNHQLRGGESDADEKFVGSLAAKYKVPVYIARVETKAEAVRKKISVQEAARHLRYAFFAAKKSELNADVVATAHNANDNAETMFLNFVRGTGLDGLAGIPLHRRDAHIVRPLLQTTRKEIASYAKEKKLMYREDSSNKTEKYTRNFVRREVFPLLEKRINPALVKTLSQSSKIFKEAADFLDGFVRDLYPTIVSVENDGLCFRSEALKKQHRYIRQMVVHHAFIEKGIDPSAERISSFVSLVEGEKGMRVDCGNGWRAEQTGGSILLLKSRPESSFSFSLEKEGTVTGDFFSLSVHKCKNVPNKLGTNSSIEYVDARKVRFPLRVRSWKEGDSFIPLGMKQRKKVSDLFVDLKIPRMEKGRIPIVESNGSIVWVAGCRIDDRYKITSNSSAAYKLSISGT
ncbi:MAG TPA: tRNA lysidine(34) synthetase TilS [Bacteroidota bacterium]|nr:tRNA lysidine(34) synthetase TilS [Bacteroidota bacterium]